MKKLFSFLVVSAVSLGGIVVVLYVFLGSMVKTGIETFGPAVAGVDVRLESASLSPLSGRGVLKGLVIGNPEGFHTESAFELGEVRVAVSPRSLLTDVIVIDEIRVRGAKVTYELGLSGSNVSRILKNVESFAGKGGGGGKSGPSKKIRIGRFEFIEGKVRIGAKLTRGKALEVPLPELKLKDIGGKRGTSPAKAAAEVLKPLTRSVTGVARKAGAGLGKVVGGAKKRVGKVIKGLKGLFKKKK